MLVKCWMFFFYRHVSKLINSDVLKATAYDSLSDCLGTLLVIGSLVAARYTAFPLDGCAGIIIALMILWAGINILKDTVSKLLGDAVISGADATAVAAPGRPKVHQNGLFALHQILIFQIVNVLSHIA